MLPRIERLNRHLPQLKRSLRTKYEMFSGSFGKFLLFFWFRFIYPCPLKLDSTESEEIKLSLNTIDKALNDDGKSGLFNRLIYICINCKTTGGTGEGVFKTAQEVLDQIASGFPQDGVPVPAQGRLNITITLLYPFLP